MVSVLNLLSGAGMVTVGVAAIAYWYLKKKPGLEYFFYGGIFWAIAIGIKLAMDLTISQPLQKFLLANMSILPFLILISLYVGVRTGLFESGITYIVVKMTKLSKMNFNEAIAVGIGFGGAEAIVLGLLSMLSIMTYILMPDLVSTLSAEVQDQFSLKYMPLPIIERTFTLLCHVFATLLAIYAVKLNDLRWLGVSVLFKTALDAVIPIAGYYLTGFSGTVLIEGYVVLLGILAYIGTIWFKNKYVAGERDAYKA
ncbi:YhfC family intramembrane metalloprotease [Methanocella sp. CWC-04]|uniref:YhfC family intramembrane metalloprotease n=1 Tax=Methanooceanicella nereidis TaxID=2052831 RepID=A0AAP2W4U7_9EURY|nr:YhfC family glutamic-type intramembrane protease [Methanocella sp. CWC-04]MCD1294765.1 YhfC family intramembrane metalloprotease [Methanocella sp. CWC-04]